MIHRTAEILGPLYDANKGLTPTVNVVQADETGQPTLYPGKGSVRKDWMQTSIDAQALLFVYSFSQGDAVGQEVLQGSRGSLAVDGHSADGVVTTHDGRPRGG